MTGEDAYKLFWDLSSNGVLHPSALLARLADALGVPLRTSNDLKSLPADQARKAIEILPTLQIPFDRTLVDDRVRRDVTNPSADPS